MRIIHTADWHLGNRMHGIDRHKESRKFLGWLKNLIVEKNASVLVVAGDIFDSANPSVEARRLYYTFLASLADTCCKNVVIIGGNHDSSVMLDSAKELLEVLNIRVVGSINNLSPEQMCFELKDGAGKETLGICMALPFVREVELRSILSDSEKCADGDLYSFTYQKLYSQVFEAAKKLRSDRNIPIIATGHLYAADLEGRLAQKKSGEKSDDGVKVLDVLGTLGNVPASVFPPCDYVALGHIHYSSMVAKNPAIRYSGSPFVMGFDEANMAHHVICADIFCDGEKKLEVEKIKTPETFLYRRISGTLAEIRDELAGLSNFLETESRPLYLELCYKRELGINAQEYLSDSISALSENVSVVSWKIADSDKIFSSMGFEGFEAAEIKNLDDREIFTQLILSKTGVDAKSEEGKSAIAKFLPLFLEIAGEV